ncbi:TonB-dependent receptor plug domain-containing protein [Longimicrobium sp.]|uniref:TonB-dependent receptor plug domain-containing protein n=1 Tax=Longimicrobium sp. TaxID=2029185 RepID=UPI003B3B70BC
MARTGHRRRNAFLHAGLAALLAAGCAGHPPADAPGPEADGVEVGYGTQKAENITGSVASLSGERLRSRRVSRVEEMFQGRLAGVAVTRLPGGGYSVRIRGASSLTEGGEPLFVVDGVPLLGARAGHELDGINPADVERIDVLKDAGSAAIYGSRAANGVILITTRRP